MGKTLAVIFVGKAGIVLTLIAQSVVRLRIIPGVALAKNVEVKVRLINEGASYYWESYRLLVAGLYCFFDI